MHTNAQQKPNSLLSVVSGLRDWGSKKVDAIPFLM